MKKRWKAQLIRERIDAILPAGKVIPRHNEHGHFYEILDGCLIDNAPPIYSSVTGKLQILKDEGLMNYKMNRAIEYVFASFKKFDDSNIMEHLDIATRVSADILADAGDIGKRVHDYREAIFNAWIESGERPVNFISFIPEAEIDIRAISALRALEKFVIENDYMPVKCETLVYNHALKIAGTLDDVGLIKQYRRPKKEGCECENVEDAYGWHRCLKCDAKWRWQFVLMDLKTSNQFKDHYFFQVAMYWDMLWRLLGKEWKPERCFILKVSKTDGSYKIEDLYSPAKLAQYAKHMIKTSEGVEFIKRLRKDNQKVVAPALTL